MKDAAVQLNGFLAGAGASEGHHWIVYASMPLIAAVIGYLTKLVAVEMMFRPIDFRGIPPFLGWQGVIPKAAPRMATTAIDLMLGKLIDPQELVRRLDPDALVKEIQEPLIAMSGDLTRELLTKYYPTLWEATPEPVRALVVRRVQSRAPDLVAGMIDELRQDLDAVLDIRMMAIDALIRDRALLVRLVRDVGGTEMRFMVRSGLLFGFLLGLAQVALWAAFHQVWMMPVFGFLVGYLTDWLALNLIFRPVKPRGILGVRFQGVFHRRRKQVAVDYGNLIAQEILTPSNILDAMLNGPSADRLLAMVNREVEGTIDDQAGIIKPFVVLAMGGRRYQEMKQDAVSFVLERFPEARSELESTAAGALDVRSLVEEKMALMTADEYEGLLRPAFKQDEWKLILIGGLLGGFIGELQVLLLLHR